MPKLPVLKPQEVVSRLELLGFIEVRQRGFHKQFRPPDGRATTVPFHKGARHLAGVVAKDCPGHWGFRRGSYGSEWIAAYDKILNPERIEQLQKLS
jgi:predicted RNA binding protein YcfA (HicA-like mRNA interferase family)